MKATAPTYTNIDEYIAQAPKESQVRLKEIKKLVKKLAPEATETISYSMPAFKLNGKGLVYYAAFKNHIGFYPFPTGVAAFKDEAEKDGFATTKGGIQFPNDRDLPVDLIKRIVEFRIEENSKGKKQYK